MSDTTNTTKLQSALNWVKTFFTTTLPASFSNVKTSVSGMETWKKWLIGITVIILIFIGSNAITGLVCYYKGTNTCKQISPTQITPATNPPEHTTIYIKKNECGDKVDLTAKMISNKKLEVTGKTKCVETKKYFDLNFNCPPPSKNELGFGPSAIVYYDNDASKLKVLVGGKVQYIRWFGSVGLGGAMSCYYGLNKVGYAGGADLLINFRF
jgi:hypothetical protein